MDENDKKKSLLTNLVRVIDKISLKSPIQFLSSDLNSMLLFLIVAFCNILCSAQGLYLALHSEVIPDRLGEACGEPGIQLMLVAAYKASTVSTVVSLTP